MFKSTLSEQLSTINILGFCRISLLSWVIETSVTVFSNSGSTHSKILLFLESYVDPILSCILSLQCNLLFPRLSKSSISVTPPVANA